MQINNTGQLNVNGSSKNWQSLDLWLGWQTDSDGLIN
jgi:hypothetical protein